MKRLNKWQRFLLWLYGISGAFLIWVGLVAIATHEYPILGGEYNPSGAATMVLAGVFFLASAVSQWWIIRAKKDHDDSE